VHGEPCTEHRYLMWETLCHLHAVSDLTWMVVGYFNETMLDLSTSQLQPDRHIKWKILDRP
jgi:hypothetical protein